MRRNPFAPWSLLAMLLLLAVGFSAHAVNNCTAGNPNANVIESTPTADFTINGNGTVTHAKTGLMWKQCAEGESGAACTLGWATTLNWADALKAANTANTAAFAGNTDWRLPNKKELESIVEDCGYDLSINQTVFPRTPGGSFWSGSSYVADPTYAWQVGFYSGDGSTSGTLKTGASSVRLVRGGQSVDVFDALNPTASVVYDGNGNTGGSVLVDGGAYANGATVTVLGNIDSLVKTGYTFAGWNTAANGSGTSYAGGATFTMGSSNVILYAKWTLNNYIVSFNSNGGSAVTPQTVAYSGTATQPAAPTKTGYTFAGWYSDGGLTSAFSFSTPITGDTTLYAKWTPTYSVTYNGNGSTGGSVPTDGNAYVAGAAVTVLSNTGNLVKTGYTFIGWNTAADGSGTSYAGGVTFTMGSGNVILYAKWTQFPTYSVTYNGNGSTGGSVPTDGNAYVAGDTITVRGNTGSLVKTGYTFAGWNTAANGSGTSYAGGATFAMGSSNVMLYAKWMMFDITPILMLLLD